MICGIVIEFFPGSMSFCAEDAKRQYKGLTIDKDGVYHLVGKNMITFN
jgi:hypothetical protein